MFGNFSPLCLLGLIQILAMPPFRILFIDAFDSFSNNIIALLEKELPISITKIHINTCVAHISELTDPFSAIIIGAGPGTATSAEDVGIINLVWKLSDKHLIPVLGICLGFQSLVWSFGGKIERLPHPRHGQKTTMITQGNSIFGGLRILEAVQYHSLCAVLGHERFRSAHDAQKNIWKPGVLAPDLVPLAWEIKPYKSTENCHSSARHCVCFSHPEKILMAVRHAQKPFYGVQFHPESICSSPEARRVMINWWEESCTWSCRNRKARNYHLNQNNGHFLSTAQYLPIANLLVEEQQRCSTDFKIDGHLLGSAFSSSAALEYRAMPLGVMDVSAVCTTLGMCEDRDHEVVVLDSVRRVPNLGTKSIIGVVDTDTLVLSYGVGSKTIQLRRGETTKLEDLEPHDNSVFRYLQNLLHKYQLSGEDQTSNSPFWGGLMGYIDYEACLETINVPTGINSSHRPNIAFALVERSIVLSYEQDLLYVQSIRKDDAAWVKSSLKKLEALREESQGATNSTDVPETVKMNNQNTEIGFRFPQKVEYYNKIQACQRELSAGNSYELCLTDQSTISIPSNAVISSWERYQRLRACNPAPFAAYIRLGSLTLLSSSPERFLRWSRPDPNPSTPSSSNLSALKRSICQFRPIKGTVKKFIPLPDAEGGGMRRVSLEEATSILSTPKEQAENLMIVDLIRHDLAGVVGAGNVHVPRLMTVEEYETVFQLVTVIEGILYQPSQPSPCSESHSSDSIASIASIGAQRPARDAQLENTQCMSSSSGFPISSSVVTPAAKTGLDVLAASLPPGSMTGAPKKRSCELLRQIEGGKPRSVYSGVLGYMDVGGGGDFSVVIRTAFKWDDEQQQQQQQQQQRDNAEHEFDELWRVGAGGAVTALSTEEGEWDEMCTKLGSVMKMWGA